MSEVFVGIGSNIEPEKNVRAAVQLLRRHAHIISVSTFYLTPPIDRPEQSPFYNGVARVDTALSIEEFKEFILRRIENELGRKRTEDKYAARTIDLDVLLYDRREDCVDSEITERPFLAIPLFELAPNLKIPGLNREIKDIVKSLAKMDMKALPEFTEQLRREIGYEHG
jgi:2-amino-4-hydroxy-6-hydroxymethyldihydropteridine diphosphokinase